ncbi:MAG: ABC transporter permease [Dehalococcoidia bacterium]
MAGALPFIIRRIIAALPVLVFVSAATFWLCRYAPGDPITVRAGPRANPEQAERIKTQLGLNDPIPVQYVRYMGNVLRGDLGESYRRQGLKVSEIIFPKMLVSLQLNIIPFILTFVVGIPLGIYAALRRGTWQDPALVSVLLLFASIPTLVMIPPLVWLFALKLKLAPTSGWHGIFHPAIILPMVVLTVPSFAGITRVVRISMIQVMGEDFVRTARAKGLRESIVLTRHVLRNALLILVNGVIYGLFTLFSGTLFVEIAFGIPGMGRETYESIGARDYDLIMAVTLISATSFILANLVLDIAYTIIDPRIRYT